MSETTAGRKTKRRPRQSITLLKYWSKGKKRHTFLLQFIQHMQLIAIVFTSATIFTNYNTVFSHVATLLNEGQTVSLSNATNPVLPISLSQVNWGQLNSTIGQMVITSTSGYLISEMNRVMLFAGIITIGLLILRESWGSLHQIRLTFMQLEIPIRGVLYHGSSRRSVVVFNIMMSLIQALSSYTAGILVSMFIVIPLISYFIRDTFFSFIVSSIPPASFLVSAIPVTITFLISISYFVFRIRTVKLN